MKPRILLTASKKINTSYLTALEAVGAEPTAIYAPKLDTSYDALLLCGGGDIDPARYNQENTASAGIDLIRDEAEFELFNAYLALKKPILGVCRGHQLINVSLGSDLIQHLDNTPMHRSGIEDLYLAHEIEALENSFVGKLYGTKFVANSFHHQAVNLPAKNLRPVAWSEDKKVIEALEHEFLPIISVQWHPERMCCDYLRSDTVNGIGIFEYFIDLCKMS